MTDYELHIPTKTVKLGQQTIHVSSADQVHFDGYQIGSQRFFLYHFDPLTKKETITTIPPKLAQDLINKLHLFARFA
ncbi:MULTISPECIES: hypothetical protein [Acinetobacter]|uniref:Uncharacterized protein n=1 Tax=Acinetobacter higginsii TaxID=70347 RepID=N9TLH8_9GAMM|nr:MULTISPECIES: hypothetical protein [Acinetobacter]ENX64110.1 hypothetical protein F902_00049 [Acinetobacter higginsii]